MKESTALFEGRLSALAHSGRMATGVAQGVTLADMARDILDGFGDRFTIDGPDLPLGPQGGQFLALAIHELATNAAKHGALANLEGRVSLSWRAEGGSFTLDWRESGGPERPPAPAAEGKGFGSRLLGHLVPGAARRRGEAGDDPGGPALEAGGAAGAAGAVRGRLVRSLRERLRTNASPHHAPQRGVHARLPALAARLEVVQHIGVEPDRGRDLAFRRLGPAASDLGLAKLGLPRRRAEIRGVIGVRPVWGG